MEHSITIRYSISVSIYCHIDMYYRSLEGMSELLDKQVDTENENLKIKFPGFTQALIKCDENKRK